MPTANEPTTNERAIKQQGRKGRAARYMTCDKPTQVRNPFAFFDCLVPKGFGFSGLPDLLPQSEWPANKK